jgi:hypothetical protein
MYIHILKMNPGSGWRNPAIQSQKSPPWRGEKPEKVPGHAVLMRYRLSIAG